jgi:NADH-quinone oxidoreductase subunit F/NADP-reducing hydrogenase subunit HndC
MLQILEKITSGRGEEGDLEKLEKLGNLIKQSSLCGLGKTAPNPVLTSLKYFRDEYKEHIVEKYCRAKVCNMGIFRINKDECLLCGLCKQACAFDAIKETRKSYFIDQDYCTKCKACYQVCPVGAIKIEKERKLLFEEFFKISFEKIEIFDRRCEMKLKDILLKLRPYEIITVHQDQSVSDAIKIMAEKNISGVFVLDENNVLVGIFTERDIVNCVTKNIALRDEKLRNVIRRDLTTFDPSTEISTVISTALRKNIRHLPVVDHNSIVGMVTFRDLLSYLLPEIIYQDKIQT